MHTSGFTASQTHANLSGASSEPVDGVVRMLVRSRDFSGADRRSRSDASRHTRQTTCRYEMPSKLRKHPVSFAQHGFSRVSTRDWS